MLHPRWYFFPFHEWQGHQMKNLAVLVHAFKDPLNGPQVNSTAVFYQATNLSGKLFLLLKPMDGNKDTSLNCPVCSLNQEDKFKRKTHSNMENQAQNCWYQISCSEFKLEFFYTVPFSTSPSSLENSANPLLIIRTNLPTFQPNNN